MEIRKVLWVGVVALLAEGGQPLPTPGGGKEEGKRVTIFGKEIIRSGKRLDIAEPVIVYHNSILEGKRGVIIGNREAILEGNVTLFRNGLSVGATNLHWVRDQNLTVDGEIFFTYSNFGGWVAGKHGEVNSSVAIFKDISFSSCCPGDPDWVISAGEGVYYRRRHYLKLYNLTLQIGGHKLLYLPWLEFPTDRKRRSGLLRPYLGLSQREGILYSQPIFWVTSPHTDLTIIPTIRILRGSGLYLQFRFLDSPVGGGELQFGEFWDRKRYQERYQLANQGHYGWEFKYHRSQLFWPGKDSLYADLKYANDVDYFYLDPSNYHFDTSYLTDKVIDSELNYLYQQGGFLVGAYNRYYIDTSKESNRDTWQLTPQLNYHQFPTKVTPHLLWSGNLNLYNYWTPRGGEFQSGTLYLPVTLFATLDGGLLQLKGSEVFYGGRGYFSGTLPPNLKPTPPSPQYSVWVTNLQISAPLLKEYPSFVHTLTPSLQLTYKNYDQRRNSAPDLLPPPDISDSIGVDLYQYLVGREWSVEHTLTFRYLSREHRWGVMENRFNLEIGKWGVEENNRYDSEMGQFVYNYLKIGFDTTYSEGIGGFISHLYDYRQGLKTFTYNLQYWPSSRKGYYWEESYDLNNHYKKYWLIGVKYDNHRCFRYNLTYKESRTPILTGEGADYIQDRIISLSVQFRPIGGVSQTLIFKKD
ncbi:MAG: hypothetical protein ABGW77_05720 [Campylobacterales bacterium]